jgi:hypothetical protein
MSSRRVLFLTSVLATAISFFTLGTLNARRGQGMTHAEQVATIRAEMRTELGRKPRAEAVMPAGTAGEVESRGRNGKDDAIMSASARTKMVAEIKSELQTEMGLAPLQMLRDRRSSFVELYSYDNAGKANYGTAGYLGHGYFITVKHAVVALHDEEDRQNTRKIASVRVMYHGKEIPAKVVDVGDADVEVHSGDWAIIKTKDLDLPSLQLDTAFPYTFAEPIFRLGNDYSKGIMLASGYVGQRMSNGLVTALTDGHPGVSGGGVLNQHGDLIGIPIGRMQGDYRFSFILPLRAQMLRKVPAFEQAEARILAADSE